MELEDFDRAIMGKVEPKSEHGTNTENGTKTENATAVDVDVRENQTQPEGGIIGHDKSVIQVLQTPKGPRLAQHMPTTEDDPKQAAKPETGTDPKDDPKQEAKNETGTDPKDSTQNGTKQPGTGSKRGRGGEGDGDSHSKKQATMVDKFWATKEKRDKNKAMLSDLEDAIQTNGKLLELRSSGNTLPPAKKALEMVEGTVNSNFRRMIMATRKNRIWLAW